MKEEITGKEALKTGDYVVVINDYEYPQYEGIVAGVTEKSVIVVENSEIGGGKRHLEKIGLVYKIIA